MGLGKIDKITANFLFNISKLPQLCVEILFRTLIIEPAEFVNYEKYWHFYDLKDLRQNIFGHVKVFNFTYIRIHLQSVVIKLVNLISTKWAEIIWADSFRSNIRIVLLLYQNPTTSSLLGKFVRTKI
jgi:hypothetical protein